MKKYILLLLIISQCTLLSGQESKVTTTLPLIPKPRKIQLQNGVFILEDATTFFAIEEFNNAGKYLQEYLQSGSTIKIADSDKSKAEIKILKDSSLQADAYTLDISENNILIVASDATGAFYGVQTLRQLLPVALEKQNKSNYATIEIPQVSIQDAPAFPYRGMHLDVGRHFFPKEFIKQYIEQLAALKMNYFHWHLTEDQGWRIEIKKYPKLTEVGAFRKETLIGHYNDIPVRYDGKQYGGFYTQEDIKEIVAFATKHHVTIIPEIELPGHSQAAISAYPKLGCTGDSIPVATTWGVFEEIYCPKESTFSFLEDVLTEVMELFPGEYIHIGGDEAPKTNWKKCNHCQDLIKKEGLEDEHELQSYLIKRIEQFVNSKGKKIIGWDEILEGGLAPNATVMSWRGTQGAVKAAKQGHDVVLTPTSHAYFDYYQSNNESEPLAIGGFLPLKKVYSFNPIPPELTTKEHQYVLGAQGNVWTEYMNSEDKVSYMVFPRILAMSEVVWKGASTNIEDDYSNFLDRLEPFYIRLDAQNINYANHLYELNGSIIKENKNVYYTLTSPKPGKEIRYTLDGTSLDSNSYLYKSPILLKNNTKIKAGVFNNKQLLSSIYSEKIDFHKAIHGKISITPNAHPSYNSGGSEALINGVQGSSKRYGDNEWLGFWGEDVKITIEFPSETNIKHLKTRFYNTQGQWIYAPKKLILKVSNDGELYQLIKEQTIESDKNIADVSIQFPEIKTQYIQIEVLNYGTIPDGKQGAGNKAWTFIDEIILE